MNDAKGLTSRRGFTPRKVQHAAQKEVAMTRTHQGGLGDAGWQRVTLRNPCPVCGGAERCSIHEESAFASCANEPSDWPLINGAWLHRLEDESEALAEAG